MNLIGTRIRVEESEHFTRYFPEFEVEEKGWFRTKRCWSSVCDLSPFGFGSAFLSAVVTLGLNKEYTKEFAEFVLIEQRLKRDEGTKENIHQATKKEYYL